MNQKMMQIATRGRGLYPITEKILEGLEVPATAVVNLFIQHTSASLLIQENADPTARADIEEFVNRLAPDDASWYRHTAEGRDDSTSHLKATFTPCSITVPIINGRLGLGHWQGVYVFEHRLAPHVRKVVVTIY